ncbi:unnamed protein product [Ectocarpus sp. 12 AP-2014]
MQWKGFVVAPQACMLSVTTSMPYSFKFHAYTKVWVFGAHLHGIQITIETAVCRRFGIFLKWCRKQLPAGASEWGSCIQRGAPPRLLPSTRDCSRTVHSLHIHTADMRSTRIPMTSASVQPSTLHVWAMPRQNIPLFCRCATPFVCRRATTRAGLEFHAKKQNFVASPLPRCSATTASSGARLELDPREFQIDSSIGKNNKYNVAMRSG